MKIIPYNTNESQLLMPEYGRNIQRMIDYCVAIEDKEERTRCAVAISEVMATLFPSMLGDKGDKQKIWDHINVMSRFKLDIEFPCEVIGKDQLSPERKKIPYGGEVNRFRHYGRNIQLMIQEVAVMDNGVEKDQLIFLIANQMKKLLVMQNPELANDARVFMDIAEISDGKIQIDPENYRLNEYLDVTQQASGKKAKKKK